MKKLFNKIRFDRKILNRMKLNRKIFDKKIFNKKILEWKIFNKKIFSRKAFKLALIIMSPFLVLGIINVVNDCHHIQTDDQTSFQLSGYELADNELVDSELTDIESLQAEGEKPALPSGSAAPLTPGTPTAPANPSTPKAPPAQTNPATSVKKGHHIYINLDQKSMYVYKDGNLVKTYPVSGGKPGTPTPVGNWRIISKDTWGEGFGGAWLGFNVPWGKYGIHGTVEPWAVGKSNASKGCIRMKNKDVRELYKIVPHGTTVTVEHNNPVFRIMKSGQIGSDIVEIQKALKKLKYYNGAADGRFGTGLKNSVIKFQKANKLRVTGIVNKQTHTLIMSKSNAI